MGVNPERHSPDRPGHVYVVVGYEQTSNELWLRIIDPLTRDRCQPELSVISYQRYASDPTDHHVKTFFGPYVGPGD